MAGTTVAARSTGMPGSDVLVTRLEHNKVVDDVETLRAGLAALAAAFNAHSHKTPTSNPGFTSIPNTDAGGSGSTGGTSGVVTVTTYDAASDMTAAKVANNAGSTTT